MATPDDPYYHDIAHLLRRAGFGGTPTEISALAQYPRAQAVDRVLDTSSAVPWNPPALAEVQRGSAKKEEIIAGTHYWLERMAMPQAPIIEKVALFWHNHFVSNAGKPAYINVWRQIHKFRTRGLGSFTELTHAVAIDPAMLDYLDNKDSTKESPNENFARELMELFTMGTGKGPDGKDIYTQKDVVECARAWTGHGVGNQFTYVFNAANHDSGQKTIFGIRKAWDGPDVINEICLGSKKAITARFIAHKFCTHFAYENPSAALVNAVTTAFMVNMNIKDLLRAMFNHDDFYSVKAKQGHLRSPVEFAAATMRYLRLTPAEIAPEDFFIPMGQRLFYPPDVSGWKVNEYWIATSTTWARSRFARAMALKAVAKGVLVGTVDGPIASRDTPETMAQRTIDLLGIDKPSAATRAALIAVSNAERASSGKQEKASLITVGLLSPDFQVA